MERNAGQKKKNDLKPKFGVPPSCRWPPAAFKGTPPRSRRAKGSCQRTRRGKRGSYKVQEVIASAAKLFTSSLDGKVSDGSQPPTCPPEPWRRWMTFHLSLGVSAGAGFAIGFWMRARSRRRERLLTNLKLRSCVPPCEQGGWGWDVDTLGRRCLTLRGRRQKVGI